MILADAIRAELFKLLHNRTTAFWAFGLTPVVTFVAGIGLETAARLTNQPLAQAMPFRSALEGLAAGGNPVVQLLMIIGAATIFAGEYRWQTWRAIVPRSTREALLLAKFAVLALATGASVLACGVAGFLVGLYSSAILHLPTMWPPENASIAAALVIGIAATLLQATMIGAMAALVAVVTRSILAATVGPFLMLIGFELAATRISILDAEAYTAALPNIAARALRELSAGNLGDPDAVGLHLATPGALALLVWTVLLIALAVTTFRRQDLPGE